MKRLKEAVITPSTSVIYPNYDGNGKLCAIVLRNGALVRVGVSPTNIVDLSLRYYGSSLRGAIDGAKTILGEISMSPVVVSEVLNLYWFPSKSPSSDDCVWFALAHIYTYKGVDKDRTRVILRDGTSFTIDSSYYSFTQKYQRACMLKNILESRATQMKLEQPRHSVSFVIYKDRKKRNYEVTEE
ncbi:competence protein ComK [Sporosarcina sp. GW1-11]|uniref:competence protein ComK n=1 Tax=Sporosarcina sp. GW1-11 TaxID=2899126 RepID=UPI00294FBC0E|nr:competence protein ComK [Sporosarcina sp. GW1-11]MDV6376956.1 competence protein ComK [Sporosarcina sp. GW1-11]